jgi:hypothetical protein
MARYAKGTGKKAEKAISTFGKRVAEFKNVTTEENVDMFGAKVVAEWNKQIRVRKTKLNSMEEDFNNAMIDNNQKLVEYKQAYENSFLDINEGCVDSVDRRSSYVVNYEAQINKALQNYEAYKQAITNFSNDYNKEVAKQLDRISFYENCLTKIQ